MSKTLVLDPATTCQFQTSQSGSEYLSCNLKGEPSNLTAFAKRVITAERHPFCSIDQYAHTHAQQCQFHASNQTFGCGCPELNNPVLKSAYERSVKSFVLRRAERQTDLTLTFFASGGLRNECDLISSMLSDLERRGWSGEINLQFVDPAYTVSKTQQVKNESESLDQNNWGYIGGAAVAGTIGLGCIWGSTKQDEQRKKIVCYVMAALFIGAAIVLLSQVQFSESSLEDREVENLTIAPDYMGAIKGMMKTIQERQPSSIQLTTSYFPTAQVCMRDGKRADGLFGYDIGGGFRDSSGVFHSSFEGFIGLKGSVLQPSGQAILVGKEGPQGEMGTPFFMRGQGPSGEMRRLDWTRI